MQPDAAATQAADTIKAIQENAQRLGLTWIRRLATVTSIEPLEAKFDGDAESVGMVSMAGPPSLNQRVYADIIPPAGIFIVGFATGAGRAPWTSRHVVGTAAATISLTDIPANLRSLRLSWIARAASGTVSNIRFRVNSNSGASYMWTHNQYRQGTDDMSGTSATGDSSALFGIINDTTVTYWSSGSVDFTNWDLVAGGPGYTMWNAQGGTYAAGVDSWTDQATGGFSFTGDRTSIQIFNSLGANIVAGSEFELVGQWS